MFDSIINFALGIIGIAFGGYGVYVLTRRDALLETARRDNEKRNAEIVAVRLDLANLRGLLDLPPYPHPGD